MMKMDIELRNGVIRYYGNPAGYVKDGKAVVDRMFAGQELCGWLGRQNLTPEWTDGVYDRLSYGILAHAGDETPLKSCRVWQLRDDVDPLMKFAGYDETAARFGEPDVGNYRLAYDGEVATNNLDELWEIFNTRIPRGFEGHSLSMSDVVELYDHEGSEFHFVDRFGFKQIEFGDGSQGQEFDMKMGV
jgi:hypothetical protein